MGLARLYQQQQQAQQLRALEVAAAKQADVDPRPLTALERGVLGVKDETMVQKTERLRARRDELRAEKAACKAARRARKDRDV